jgi:hypothetical protein
MRKKLPLFFIAMTFFIGRPLFAIENLITMEESHFITLNQEESRVFLEENDAYILKINPGNIAVRMQNSEADIKDFLLFNGLSAMNWKEEEKTKVKNALSKIKKRLRNFRLPLPGKVFLIKTNGKENFSLPYTRRNAIVFPKKLVEESIAEIVDVLSHEIFHIMSTYRPDLKDIVYPHFGFERAKTSPVVLPKSLTKRVLVNPDALENNFLMKTVYQGEDVKLIPLFYGRKILRELFLETEEQMQYQMKMSLLLLDEDNNVRIDPISNTPILLSVSETDYIEKTGENTHYLIHAEEIAADNFMLFIKSLDETTPMKRIKSESKLDVFRKVFSSK